MVNEIVLHDVLYSALSGDLTKEALLIYARRYSEGGTIDQLLGDFAVFVCRPFLAHAISFHEANGALNVIMPTVGHEQAPAPFWEAYVAFEDFELSRDPDHEARPRVEDALRALGAV